MVPFFGLHAIGWTKGDEGTVFESYLKSHTLAKIVILLSLKDHHTSWLQLEAMRGCGLNPTSKVVWGCFSVGGAQHYHSIESQSTLDPFWTILNHFWICGFLTLHELWIFWITFELVFFVVCIATKIDYILTFSSLFWVKSKLQQQ